MTQQVANDSDPQVLFNTLQDVLVLARQDSGALSIAVSGGVDSMTLAVVAGRNQDLDVHMLHAISPAVPPDATVRVRRYAEQEGWRLHTFDAGEFADPNYRANPANRCFFCKTNLYATMAEFSRTVNAPIQATLVSGTNTDDLGDYRPGLQAAADHGVRHPYVDAGIDKAGVRALARWLELHDLAELPAAPCLSSRIETGIPIDPAALMAVDTVEKFLRTELRPRTVRCRVREHAVSIELDAASLAALSDSERDALAARIGARFAALAPEKPVQFDSYRMGSAFLRDTND